MAWKDIPEKKVLATLKDRKTFKGVAAEKMTIYVDGAVPGGDGDVQGISMTVDPSTYVMTTQLKDGKGGNVGDPATVDLPLESMVVSGEYDDATKSVILTLKNGETVSFSVADLVAGLQTEITSENPLSADLIEETSNKNFVTEQEKEDIDDIQNIRDSIADIEGGLDGKQDTIDANNPLNADFVDDGNSDKKFVTQEEKDLIEDIPDIDETVAGLVDSVSDLSDSVGDLSSLDTTDKSSLVNAINEVVEGSSGGGGVLTLYMLDPFNTYPPEVGDHFEFCRDKELTDPITATELDAALNEGKAVQINCLYNAGDDWGPNYLTITDFYDDGSYGSYMSFTLRSSNADAGYRVQFCGDNNYATVIEIQSYSIQADWNEAYDSSSAFIKNKPTIPSNVSDLTNDAGYQNASQVSSAIASAVGDITSFEYQVVQALPVTGEKGVIYLVANSGTTPNIYDEYIWVNNAFEKIGTTDIDLSDYVTNSDLHDYTASVAFTSENGIEITDDDDNSIGFTIETDAETGSQNLAVTGPDGSSFNVPNADDVTDALAGKADAIDPSDLPSGSTQNGVITTSDHTDIDPSVVSEGQIVVDSTENKVYIVSDITTDPQTGDPVIVWKEIQTDEMVILDYGTSTWSEFLTAYNDKRIVYCRASSGTDPSVGDKTRMAFMAYITNPSNPTGVEFQYYRSVNTKSASNQTDQVVVYKLTSNGTWTVETRNTNVKIAAGTNMTSSYSGGTLTLSADLSSKQDVIDANHKLSADLIDNSNSTNKTYETGTGAPTSSTTGSVGELYVDSNTGKVYVCTDDTGGTYTWEEVGGTSAQTGSTAPSTSTVGEIGQIYVNTTDGKSYICTDTTGGTYTWVELIPTVNDATLTIQKNGTTVQTFTANASSNKTANIEVPVITMQTTDPGEGVALAANNFIAVYEA